MADPTWPAKYIKFLRFHSKSKFILSFKDWEYLTEHYGRCDAYLIALLNKINTCRYNVVKYVRNHFIRTTKKYEIFFLFDSINNKNLKQCS